MSDSTGRPGPAPMVECPQCLGEGEIYPADVIGIGLISDPVVCPFCNGYAEVERWRVKFFRKPGEVRRG